MPDRVHASVDAMQPRGAHAVVDGRHAQTDRHKLTAPDDTVLTFGQPGDPEVIGEFTAHIAV
jgi:hypothetical protein